MFKKTIINSIFFILILGLGIFIGIIIQKKTGKCMIIDPAALMKSSEKIQKNASISENGFVKQVSENSLILRVSDKADGEKTVKITKDTKFYQLIQKDQQQFQKEMDAYNKKLQEALAKNLSEKIAVPSATQGQKEITLVDIKVGQIVQVMASEDISSKKEFTAVSVSVMPQ